MTLLAELKHTARYPTTNEILNRICPNEKAHRFVSRHGNTYCARCGIKPADMFNYFKEILACTQ